VRAVAQGREELRAPSEREHGQTACSVAKADRLTEHVPARLRRLGCDRAGGALEAATELGGEREALALGGRE
jgi:hypothetical protein